MKLTQKEFDAIPHRDEVPHIGTQWKYSNGIEDFVISLKPCGGFYLHRVEIVNE